MRSASNPAIAQWQALRQFKSFAGMVDATIERRLSNLYDRRHGHFNDWLDMIGNMPTITQTDMTLNQATPRVYAEITQAENAQLTTALKALMPWRKGPFHIADTVIDSEWRSDLKYERLQALGLEVRDKHVLDVGTGNGYFLYRLLGSGASLAVGVDPSWHYFAQFLALQRYFAQPRAIYLPMTLDDGLLTGFDVTMSMGVLYHRRDPMQYLWQLRETIRSGGQLVIETLIVDGDEQTVFMPQARYAGMRNVWFLPSAAALERWLARLGLTVISKSDVVATTSDEQRQTAWMDRHSLADFMSADGRTTIEGSPPPQRIIMIAEK